MIWGGDQDGIRRNQRDTILTTSPLSPSPSSRMAPTHSLIAGATPYIPREWAPLHQIYCVLTARFTDRRRLVQRQPLRQVVSRAEVCRRELVRHARARFSLVVCARTVLDVTVTMDSGGPPVRAACCPTAHPSAARCDCLRVGARRRWVGVKPMVCDTGPSRGSDWPRGAMA